MKAVFYAQFSEKAGAARLIRASQKPPVKVEGVLVKVSLTIPDGAFKPLEAEGDIEAGFVGIPIEVAPEEIREFLARKAVADELQQQTRKQ